AATPGRPRRGGRGRAPAAPPGGRGTPWRGAPPARRARAARRRPAARWPASSSGGRPRRRLGALHREPQREHGAALGRALGSDLAPVLGDDLVADREAEPGALADRLGGEERVEDAPE